MLLHCYYFHCKDYKFHTVFLLPPQEMQVSTVTNSLSKVQVLTVCCLLWLFNESPKVRGFTFSLYTANIFTASYMFPSYLLPTVFSLYFSLALQVTTLFQCLLVRHRKNNNVYKLKVCYGWNGPAYGQPTPVTVKLQVSLCLLSHCDFAYAEIYCQLQRCRDVLQFSTLEQAKTRFACSIVCVCILAHCYYCHCKRYRFQLCIACCNYFAHVGIHCTSTVVSLHILQCLTIVECPIDKR